VNLKPTCRSPKPGSRSSRTHIPDAAARGRAPPHGGMPTHGRERRRRTSSRSSPAAGPAKVLAQADASGLTTGMSRVQTKVQTGDVLEPLVVSK
jgi:hypothetical protein